MAKEKDLKREDIQGMAYDTLMAVISDPKTSAAVKVQASTQLVRLAETMKDDSQGQDELEKFLNS